MPIYRGVSGVNRELKNIYRGVSGVNREIQEQYRGVSGVNRTVFQSAWDGLIYSLPTDISNSAKLENGEVKLDYSYDGSGTPYIIIHCKELITIESLRFENVKAYNYQSNPNKSKTMTISVHTSGYEKSTFDTFNYVDSNQIVYRSFNCPNCNGSIIKPNGNDRIQISVSGERHRDTSNVVCAALTIPNKSIILNGRPIDFTKMTAK